MSEAPPNKSLLAEIKGIGRLWPYIRDQKKLLIVAMVLVPAISLLEMNIPIIIKWTIDHGIDDGDFSQITLGAGVYLFLVVFQFLCRSGQAIAAGFAVHRMVKTLRRTLIIHVLNLSCRFHDRSMSGRLVTRATSDFDNLSESLNMGVLTTVIDFAVLTGSLVGLFYLNWRMALVGVLVLPVIGVVVSFFSRSLKKTMLKARAKIAELNGFTQECLYGMSTLKTLTAEAAAQERFDDLNEQYRKAQMNSVVLDASMFSIIDGMTSITVGLILFFAVSSLDASSGLTAGLMVAFVQYIQQMFEPVKHLSNKIAMLQGAFTSLDRIFGILEEQDFVEGEATIEHVKGDVRFEDVAFAYRDDQSRPTLAQLSFHLPSGHSLAIVGATGSGKSTIVKLISKLYSGYDGKIWLDNQDLSSLDSTFVRRALAIVPQDIVIFDGSIAFNISLGLAGVSQHDIEAAAKTVGADHFIESLPGSYDYRLKEQGTNLSQGQRQLIAFARALATNPKMIVLDEATSSVDPESEAIIQRGIDSMMAGRTVIVIAHRLSTIQKCDHILVIDQGKKVEWGNHQELLQARGAYYRLHTALASPPDYATIPAG